MSYSLRCPICRGKFPWKDPTQGFPSKCELCGETIGVDVPDDVIVMPSLRSAKMAATDKVYRDMERGSEVRAQAAADLVGAPVAEMSSLKITNLKDNQREGDIAAMESQAAMDRFKTFTPTPVGWQANGAELASGVASGAVSVNNQVYAGIEPRAGARAIERVQRKLGIV